VAVKEWQTGISRVDAAAQHKAGIGRVSHQASLHGVFTNGEGEGHFRITDFRVWRAGLRPQTPKWIGRDRFSRIPQRQSLPR
jgi:hypothetical protein